MVLRRRYDAIPNLRITRRLFRWVSSGLRSELLEFSIDTMFPRRSLFRNGAPNATRKSSKRFLPEDTKSPIMDVFTRHRHRLGQTRMRERYWIEALNILESINGDRPQGYRAPSWELSADSLRLRHECGFVYNSSLMGDDIPCFVEADN